MQNSHVKRSQTEIILKDLKKKMVFLTGPKQSGKTWLSREIAKSYSNPVYLRYDHYLRTKEGREVDFCLAEGNQIKAMIEVKTDDSRVSRHLKYYHTRYGFKGYQIVRYLKQERMEDGIELRAADSFLSKMDMG